MNACYTAVVGVIGCRGDAAGTIVQAEERAVRARRGKIGAGALGVVCSWSCLYRVGRGCGGGSGGGGRRRGGDCGIICLCSSDGGADVVRVDR